jgi:hypothetical protein
MFEILVLHVCKNGMKIIIKKFFSISEKLFSNPNPKTVVVPGNKSNAKKHPDSPQYGYPWNYY